MTSTKRRKKLLQNSTLYAILDTRTAGCARAIQKAKEFRRADIDIVQLRDKQAPKKEILKRAKELARALSGGNTLFIVNDHLDIAQLAACDGVHLGQDDIPIEEARKLLGKEKIIGISCHSLPQALNAQKKGADYIGVGPVFKTPTKPEYKSVGLELVRQCAKKIKIPFFAIGGINLGNLNQVTEAGAKRVAVCRELCQARNVEKAALEFKTLLKSRS